MSNDGPARRIIPQDSSGAQPSVAAMGSFPFIPHQYPQRETQKNYVFVDEHNRHKRLKVMRACEGCRRRKIRCDAATTNTWPCSACIRLKLHCVRPNGFDGSSDSTITDRPPATAPAASSFETIMNASAPFSHVALPPHAPKHAPDFYASHAAYPDPDAYQAMSFDSHHGLHYTTAPPPPVSALDPHPQSYAPPPQNFPTPPTQQSSRPDSSSEACSTDSYQQQDLAGLLGTLRVDELGTAPYLRNKASFRHHEMPAVEDDDDFESVLPPIVTGPGHKVRVPPALMPDDASALHYFDLYFTYVHPFVPVLDKAQFYRQWTSARDTISPLILEALFAIGGRLAEDPAQGHQWLALASRHADSFMDVPRLSTLQALLMILKAREAAPKRGYYYRSWMTVVQCVQMAKDLGLDEHHEDHQAGRPCESPPAECQLRTRIWQTIFICEIMIGTPQGRHDLSVGLETVDFDVPSQVDDGEYQVSRNFTYFARLVRNIGRMSQVYAKIRKKREWGMDPEFQQLRQSITSFLSELPADMTITFPPDSSPPWVPSSFLGNLHLYYHLTLILYHRPVLSFLDPTTNALQWRQHMRICYDAAKSLCRLQEGIMQSFGLTGLQAMQRGYSFTIYAGLSCVVLHLVAIVSPDPELNSDAPEYFTRHMRIVEQVMEAWPMPELQKQIDAVREAFSADLRRPFVLSPNFPYGSPRSTSHPSPPGAARRRPLGSDPTGSLEQHLGTPNTQSVSYPGHPISPPVSAGPGDGQGDVSPAQSLVLMPLNGQATDVRRGMALPESHSTWNPARIFEQWNTSFGTPVAAAAAAAAAAAEPMAGGQIGSLNMAPSSGTSDISSITADQGGVEATLAAAAAAQSMPTHSYSNPSPMDNFITPAMWQESVASVYEGGLKRSWDYDPPMGIKRR